jgi:hypothetical protein
MTASQRVKEIERILREDPRRYWDDPALQRELREKLAAMHGEPPEAEHLADSGLCGIDPDEAPGVVLAEGQ